MFFIKTNNIFPNENGISGESGIHNFGKSHLYGLIVMFTYCGA